MQAEATRERVRYTPYFIRPERPRPIAITERDLEIMAALLHHRLMNMRQLQRLFGARVNHRLPLLYHHGYVDRPDAQRILRLPKGGGSLPIVYALGNKGAAVLKASHGSLSIKRDWSERNRELKPWSIPHPLQLTEVRVAFETACRERGDVWLIDKRHHTTWPTILSAPGERRPLVPDWIFMLDSDGEQSREPGLFFVELDRGTEPNERRRSPALQSLERKYKSYLAYARAKRHKEQFGLSNFRVLTVVAAGPRKLDNVVMTMGEVTHRSGPGRFLVTTMDALREQGPFAPIWLDARGTDTVLG